MKQTLRYKIILTAGLSTFLLMSLYWLAGWHLIESIEHQSRQQFVDYIGSRVDQALAGKVPAQALELFDMMTLYRENDDVPVAWRALTPPATEALPNEDLLVVRRHPQTGQPYYLVMHNVEEVLESGKQEEAEILLVLGGIALITFGAMGLTLLITWQLTQPIRQLTRQLEHIDPARPVLEPLERNDEIGFMSRQFASLLQRTAAFINRERNFTRFASHELRSPIMVVRSSLDLLRETVPPSEINSRALKRIDDASSRMIKLIEAFLWLGRETKPAPEGCVDRTGLEHILEELFASHPALQSRQLEVTLDDCHWQVHPFVLSVVIDNLLRNALIHGDGHIRIGNDTDTLTISNDIGDGDHADAQSHGYGLLIASQLCQDAGIGLELTQEPRRYSAQLHFAAQAGP
ncbi:two-component sensor histidine kinase [Marinobacterium nitratireducens]|uniref:histidine kinase n=1 Tax=Marinobacterium nitratireducens TaxID=518897 RepID=A0A917ZG67_9GAMM|nr:sensor histidine kinase [Marinobacterium nitratireducens]GGO81242.1 two-component sensor histidine kinase [Marinobacterium nitratireducens]